MGADLGGDGDRARYPVVRLMATVDRRCGAILRGKQSVEGDLDAEIRSYQQMLED
jgi:hypothetical protein